MDYCKAQFMLHDAARNLTRVDAIHSETGRVSEVFLKFTLDAMTQAAADLGYRLEPIQAPQQAHESALAARIAENDPGFITPEPQVFNDPRNDEAA